MIFAKKDELENSIMSPRRDSENRLYIAESGNDVRGGFAGGKGSGGGTYPELVDMGTLGTLYVRVPGVANHNSLVGTDAVALQGDFVDVRVGLLATYLFAQDNVGEEMLQTTAGNLLVLHFDKAVADDGQRITGGKVTHHLLGIGEKGEVLCGEDKKIITHAAGKVLQRSGLHEHRAAAKGLHKRPKETVGAQEVFGDLVLTVAVPEFHVVGMVEGEKVIE